ncbi:hypothetical protein FVEN_g13205 [Fusarium venenatum]|nr:hypothetical protein FVEN_g13205 [Fusarium venenatum]
MKLVHTTWLLLLLLLLLQSASCMSPCRFISAISSSCVKTMVY